MINVVAIGVLVVVVTLAGIAEAFDGLPGWAFGVAFGLLMAGFAAASWLAYDRLMSGMGRQPHPPGPHAILVGHLAVVVSEIGSELRVQVATRDWPARLPPFVRRPPIGSWVRIEAVADNVLVVRPEVPPPA